MNISENGTQRVGECHCGALKVITAGEPERVYLCHCKACQRRTGTAFHFGVTYRRSQVRLAGQYKIYERGADSGSQIRFYFCPNCGSNLRWESERNPMLCGWPAVRSTTSISRRARQFSRSRCIAGSNCRV